MTPPEPPQDTRRRPYQRSGFYGAKRSLVKYGARILPGRETPIGRELRDWRLSLIVDLGGLEMLSTQQLALVDQAVVQRYLVASLDGYVLSLPALVNKRSRCLFPIVRERAAQVNLLRDLLRDLGLERRAREDDVAATLAALHGPSSNRGEEVSHVFQVSQSGDNPMKTLHPDSGHLPGSRCPEVSREVSQGETLAALHAKPAAEEPRLTGGEGGALLPETDSNTRTVPAAPADGAVAEAAATGGEGGIFIPPNSPATLHPSAVPAAPENDAVAEATALDPEPLP